MDENKNCISTSKAWSVLTWYSHLWRCFRKGAWEDYLTGVEESHGNTGVALSRTWLMWRGGSMAKMIDSAKCELFSRAALLVLFYPVPTAGHVIAIAFYILIGTMLVPVAITFYFMDSGSLTLLESSVWCFLGSFRYFAQAHDRAVISVWHFLF